MKAPRTISSETCAKISEVWRRLGDHYCEPQIHPTGDPVGELVLTILSQHTTDASSARAFADLRAQYPNWELVSQAPIEEIATAIRYAGLPLQKATTIQRALRLTAEFDMQSLRDLPLAEARSKLTAIKGVGDKTASCVLLFALGQPAQPVDTHIERVSKRVGLNECERNASGVQRVYEHCLPADAQTMFAFHVDMIRHGREVCLARTPKCSMCFMTDICDFYGQHVQVVG